MFEIRKYGTYKFTIKDSVSKLYLGVDGTMHSAFAMIPSQVEVLLAFSSREAAEEAIKAYRKPIIYKIKPIDGVKYGRTATTINTSPF